MTTIHTNVQSLRRTSLFTVLLFEKLNAKLVEIGGAQNTRQLFEKFVTWCCFLRHFFDKKTSHCNQPLE
jgi:hypothetical protein